MTELPTLFNFKLWLSKYQQNRLSVQFSSVTQSCPTLCDPMNSSTPGLPVHHHLLEFTQTHVRPSSQWCHPAISPSVIPFSSCPQSLPASEASPMSQLFAWGGQSTGVSALASVLPKNTQDGSPLEWTGLISLSNQLVSILNCGYININKIDSESMNIKRDAFKDTFTIWPNNFTLIWSHMRN